MSLWERMKSSLRSARDPVSLDHVEEVMEEEERERSNENLRSPDWLRVANVLLVIIVTLFILFAWHLQRYVEGIGERNGNSNYNRSAL
jgi:type VI protein secretion system component VasF